MSFSDEEKWLYSNKSKIPYLEYKLSDPQLFSNFYNKELLKDIFDKHHLAEDFSIYLHRPTATDPSFAPEGHDSYYALVPVPNLKGNYNWDEIKKDFST